MKLPLLAVLAFLPLVAVAQSTTDSDSTASSADQSSDTVHKHRHHHLDPTQQLAFLTKKLNLTTNEQGDIGPVLTSRDTQAKTIFQDQSLTKEQKHDQIKALRESSDKQIESYLNAEQVTQFEALHHHHHEASTNASSDTSNP